jgi:hypothetical protein
MNIFKSSSVSSYITKLFTSSTHTHNPNPTYTNDILFEVNIKDNLYFAYSDLNNKKNEKYWIDYYKKNYDKQVITNYYSDVNKSTDVLNKIVESSKDTAEVFIQLIKISKKGSPYVKQKCKLKNIIKGVCFIKDVSGNSFDSTNILMTVGVFTSESAAFYVMVGVCIGNNYSGVKQKGLSKTLFKNVAIMMKNETDFFSQKKNSFITRPLEKMGELLKTDNTKIDELAISFDEDRKLNNDNENTAIEWLKNCNEKCEDGEDIDICKMNKCIGDICFLRHFVLDAFSPKWGYAGKRIETLITGGQHLKYSIRKLQNFAKIFNIKYIGKKKSILIQDIIKINLKTLSISQIKEYCKFLNIKGYTKYKTKSKLLLLIKNRN